MAGGRAYRARLRGYFRRRKIKLGSILDVVSGHVETGAWKRAGAEFYRVKGHAWLDGPSVPFPRAPAPRSSGPSHVLPEEFSSRPPFLIFQEVGGQID